MPDDSGKSRHRWRAKAVGVAFALYAVVFAWNVWKPLPNGLSVSDPIHDAAGMEFLWDLTYHRGGEDVVDQRIFDRVFSMIDAAEEFVVIDMFLFDGEHGEERTYRPLASQLTDRLVERRMARPNLRAVFITDEINNFYGAYTSPEIARLRAAGVEVLATRSKRLRDSNPLYSAAWRILVGWLGTGGPGWLPHPLSSTGRKVTLRSYLKLLNFKANHRKLLITDRGCMVASANPHDASGFHSNIAFAGSGPVCADLLASERAVAAFSGGDVEGWPVWGRTGGGGAAEVGDGQGGAGGATGARAPMAGTMALQRQSDGPDPREVREEEAGRSTVAGESDSSRLPSPGTVQLVTEGNILDAFLRDVGAAGAGDRVDVAMFYVAERKVVEALLEAHGRGAEVRLVLDPNKDAFGRQKGGIPNRQVARELVERSGGGIQVRWYETRGEQFHTKLVIVTRPDSVSVMGGSANLTRRNIRDYNLETDLRFHLSRESDLARAAGDYFQRIFTNRDADFTLPYEAYPDDGLFRRALYRIQELTGVSSF